METLVFVRCKQGRVFEVGRPLENRALVVVDGIRKTGNFVQVDFRVHRAIGGVAPGPVVLHVADIAEMR